MTSPILIKLFSGVTRATPDLRVAPWLTAIAHGADAGVRA